MIGMPVILIYVGVLSSLVLMGWVSLSDWRKTRRWRGAITATVFAVLFILAGIMVADIVAVHSRLHALNQTNVEWIEVNGRRIADPSVVSRLIVSLSQAEWFEGRNIGADWLPLKIALSNGTELRYRVANRVRNEGALLSFGEDKDTRTTLGSAGRFYVKDLAEVLEAGGMPLPTGEDRSR